MARHDDVNICCFQFCVCVCIDYKTGTVEHVLSICPKTSKLGCIIGLHNKGHPCTHVIYLEDKSVAHSVHTWVGARRRVGVGLCYRIHLRASIKLSECDRLGRLVLGLA